MEEVFFKECNDPIKEMSRSNLEFSRIGLALVPEFVAVALTGCELVGSQGLHIFAFVTHTIVYPDFGSRGIKEVKLNVACIRNLIAQLHGISADQGLLEMQSDFRRSLGKAILVIASARLRRGDDR